MATIRAKFIKGDLLKFIGHLDLMRLLKRAFSRANIDVKYSQGYNPQPKLAFAMALALGVSSQGEYFDLEIENEIDINDFIKKINEVLPKGIEIIGAKYVDDSQGIMSQIKWSSYIIEMFLNESISNERLSEMIKNILDRDEIIIIKEKKKGKRITKKDVNIRDLIKSIELMMNNDDEIIIKTMLKTGSYGNLKPDIIVDLLAKEGLNIDSESTNIERIELFIEKDGNIITPI